MMRTLRKFIPAIGVAMLLAAMTATSTLAAPANCGELAAGALYHGQQGNYDYGGWLLQLAIDEGCFN